MIASSQTKHKPKILIVCTLDLMAAVLLRPWLDGLLHAGYEVHIACAQSGYFDQLANGGFVMHEVRLRRRLNPLLHVYPFWQLLSIISRFKFDIVNCHSPVAAAVGRMAAWFARCQCIVYTVHGFYFHDEMQWLKRNVFLILEWGLSRITSAFMFVSDEDRETALRSGMISSTRSTTIYNGVNLQRYRSSCGSDEFKDGRKDLDIDLNSVVVGTVGRIVREKGYLEFIGMAKSVAKQYANVVFLVVGDSLPSDRDGIRDLIESEIKEENLQARFRFVGFVSDVNRYLRLMDLFVLPSWREGFPRSILEAMATGLPVITTNIRGCREAVVDNVTGLIVPTKSAEALTDAVTDILDSPDLGKRMGAAGQRRAEELFDERLIQARFVDFLSEQYLKQKEQSCIDARQNA